MIPSGWPEILPRPGNRKLKRVQSLSPWFEIRRVDGDTFAILEPNHFEEVISYLILGHDRALLFDTGMGIGDIRAEVERFTDLPLIVVNSHFHYDHIGGNHLFEDIRAGDNGFEVTHIEQGHNREECREFMEPGSYLELPPGFDPSRYEIKPSRVTRRLKHQETIDLGGRVLTVLHTPGETPGGISLLDSRQGCLFTGDVIYAGTLWVHLEESDFAVYLDSLEYLCGLLDRIGWLCPAHNEAFVEKGILLQAREAFDRIAEGRPPDLTQEGSAVHRFQGFNVALEKNQKSDRTSPGG